MKYLLVFVLILFSYSCEKDSHSPKFKVGDCIADAAYVKHGYPLDYKLIIISANEDGYVWCQTSTGVNFWYACRIAEPTSSSIDSGNTKVSCPAIKFNPNILPEEFPPARQREWIQFYRNQLKEKRNK